MPSDIREIEKALGGNAWRLTPATFAAHCSYGTWQPARHLKYISARIAAACSKGGARIIVSMPARHGKSKLCSVWTPTWFLDAAPHKEVILSSYGAELATDFSREVRDIILDAQDPESPNKFRVKLRKDTLRSDRFLTTLNGGLRAVGIGGTIIGRGADLFLLDDFIKNPKEAFSPAMRSSIIEWFQGVVRNRVHPGGNIIIIAHRWHKEDLIGFLLNEQPGIWEHIKLPARALENDPLGREVGEPLWPERFDDAELTSLQQESGNYFWQALYQQEPIRIGGDQVARGQFHKVDIVPMERLKLIRSWDLAATPEGGQPDYTVGVLLGIDKATNHTYVCDVRRRRVGPAGVEKLLLETAQEDGFSIPIHIEQEPGSSGKIAVDYYVRKVLLGYKVNGEKSTGDKFVRAQPFLGQVQAGNVFIKEAPWNRDYLDEFEAFPEVAHDDQVDATSGAFNKLTGRSKQGVTWGRGNSSIIKPKTPQGKLITGITFGRKIA